MSGRVRNISYDFRVAPIEENSEMLLLRPENPEFKFALGRYTLVVARSRDPSDRCSGFITRRRTAASRMCGSLAGSSRTFGTRKTPFRVTGPTGAVTLMSHLEQAYSADIKIRAADEKVPLEGIGISVTEYEPGGCPRPQAPGGVSGNRGGSPPGVGRPSPCAADDADFP